MKLQPDKSSAPTIQAHGPGWIEVNVQRYNHSLVVSSLEDLPSFAWEPESFAQLTAQDFEQLALNGVELVILGCGQRLQFPHARDLQALMAKGIGLESMDTAAACRTYNILASEGRKVLAALIIET